MREYIDIISRYLAESILAELETVPSPGNESKEIGSGGTSVEAGMSDMLPHHGVADRNKPQAFAQIFAKVAGNTYETGFERETPPSDKKLKRRRNNDAGIKKLTRVPKGGDTGAMLHHDFAANRKANNKPILP